MSKLLANTQATGLGSHQYVVADTTGRLRTVVEGDLLANVGLQADAEATGNGSVNAVLKRIRTLVANIGLTTDVEATADGSVIALLKRIRTLLAGTLVTSNTVQGYAAGSYIAVQANAWSAAAVAANGTSANVDTAGRSVVTAFGNVSAAATITLQVSADGTTWYDSSTTHVLGAAGNFYINTVTAARFVRLKSSAAATITASIAVKS